MTMTPALGALAQASDALTRAIADPQSGAEAAVATTIDLTILILGPIVGAFVGIVVSVLFSALARKAFSKAATASSMNERQREISATSTRAVTAATHTIAILRPTARISSRSISYSTSNDGGFRLASISTFTRSPPRTPTGSGLDLAFRRASSCPSAYGKAPAPYR